MPVIPVNKVVDPKRIIIEKMEGRGGETQGVADPKKKFLRSRCEARRQRIFAYIGSRIL
jgi:hypothetical protein